MTLSFLILARHFAEPGSGGARRPMLMASALARAGHRVCVVTPFLPDTPMQGVDILHIPLPAAQGEEKAAPGARDTDPRAATPQTRTRRTITQWLLDALPARTALALRRWKYMPDFDIVWADRVRDILLTRDDKFDWVMTSAPPESLHVHGAEIAAHFGGRWVMDWRDSWIENSHRTHVRGRRARREARLARRLLAVTDAVICVDRVIAAEITRLSAAPRPRLTLGHFSVPFSGVPTALDRSAFHLVHAGGLSLSYHRRRAEVLFAELDRVSAARTAQNLPPLVFHILGRLTPDETALAERAATQIIAHGPVTLPQSRALQAGADALLLWVPQDSLALPGKYAECVQSGRPVIYLGTEDIRLRAPAYAQFAALSDLMQPAFDGQPLSDPTTHADHAVERLLAFLAKPDETGPPTG